MGNMAYCRYENTLQDLRECYEHWEEVVGEDEEKARKRLLKLCKSIINDYGDDD